MQKRAGRPRVKYPQAGRVLVIYDRLHRSQVVRMADIADLLDVSARTLQRDVALLREVLGDDLKVHDGPQRSLELNSKRRRWRTSPKLVMGMLAGTKLMRFFSGRTFDSELEPLISQLCKSLPALAHEEVRDLERRLHIVESGYKQVARDDRTLNVLDDLVRALLMRHLVEIHYRSAERQRRDEPARVLRVQVICMTIHRGAVYFVVDQKSPQPARRILLALDRVTAAAVDQDARPFPYPKDFDARAFFASAFGVWRGEAEHHVRIRISPAYAPAVRERTWHASQQVEELKDGTLRITMILGTLHEVADWVLGMGEHARVEGPAELVAMLKCRLSHALAKYDEVPATYSVRSPDHPPSSAPRRARDGSSS